MDIKSITGGNKIQETSHAEKRHTPSYLNKSEPDTFERTTKTETKKDKNLIEQIKDYCTAKNNPSGNEEEKALEDIENSAEKNEEEKALEDIENSAEKKYTKDPMCSPAETDPPTVQDKVFYQYNPADKPCYDKPINPEPDIDHDYNNPADLYAFQPSPSKDRIEFVLKAHPDPDLFWRSRHYPMEDDLDD